MRWKIKKEYVVLVFILLLAAFFRFFRLSSFPPGLYPDEAANANQALAEPGRIFYPENNGREGLFINLLALSFKVLGPSIISARIVPAFFGVLTVLGIYLLGKELFSPFVGLASSFLLGVSFWHINFSRILFRAILVPFFLTYTFYFLLKGLKNKKLFYLAAAGLFYGAGFHTYISYRFSVLILPLFFLLWWRKYKKEKEDRRFLLFTIYYLLFTVIIALPIGIYFLLHPAHFLARAGGVSVFSQPKPWLALGKSLVKHLTMFHLRGDPNWRHNIASQPVLFWPAGILFLLGLFYSVYKLFKSLKDEQEPFVIGYKLLVVSFFIMLLPGVLTAEGIPHSLRVIGAVPPVFLLAGLGLSLCLKWSREKINWKKFSLLKALTSLLVFMFCFFFSLAGFYRYFAFWGTKQEVRNAFSSHYVQVGRLINELEGRIYVVVNQGGTIVDGVPIPGQTPQFIERVEHQSPQAIYIREEEIEDLNREEATIIPLVYKMETLGRILENLPRAELKTKRNIIYLQIQP